ncbi:MAG: beta-galactosidase [Thermomicrobiales bacterium]
MPTPYPYEPSERESGLGKVPPPDRVDVTPGVAARSAQAVAAWLLDVMDWQRRHRDVTRLIFSLIILIGGLFVGGAAALIDNYLHRGVETGVEIPYVVQPTGKELATNVDLRLFPDSEIGGVATELKDGGFRYVRQEFTWSQIETAEGTYDWSEYDLLVQSLAQNGIQVIAVVKGTPAWARASSGGQDGPPDDPARYQAFMQQLTSRYGGRVPFVQIWDRPNLASQWGGTPADADAFIPLLAAGFNGARSGNAEVKIITPELALTSDTAGGQTDLAFLRSLFDLDASPFFDIVGLRLDGGTLSPDDRRVAPDRVNISRAILYRDIVVKGGDAATPIWATSFGWSATGTVTRDRQAEFVIRAMTRSWAEWPWMGLMVQWEFIDPDASSRNSTYAVVYPEGRATPLFQALSSAATQQQAALANTGFAPMDSVAFSYGGTWQDQHLEGRTFKTTSEQDSSVTIRFRGTGLIAYLRSGPQSGRLHLTLDGTVIPGGYGDDGTQWSFRSTLGTDDLPQQLLGGLDDADHVLTITLVGTGELTVGGVIIQRDAPFLWPIVLLTVGSLVLIFVGVRSLAYLVAVRTGYLIRKEMYDPAARIQRMPDWRPARRA